MKARYLGIAALGLLAAGLAPAQKHEIGLTLGTALAGSRTSPQGRIDVGRGVALQANYGYLLAGSRWAALLGEVHFLAGPLREIDSPVSSVTRDFATLFVLPGVRVTFRRGAAWSPYTAVGAGYALYEQSLARLDGAPNPAPRFTHRGALGFGGGLDFPVWRFVGGRVEVRDFYTGNPSYNAGVSGGQHTIVAGGGIVVRLGRSER